jgi:glycosyltransferase involved in cell wall biosynthesis
VVVPCGRPERAIPTLESLARQAYPGTIEAFCVGHGVSALTGRFPFLQTIDSPTPLSPAQARNRGAREARGTHLLFLDDDCTVDPDWIARNVAELESDPRIGAVGGRIGGASPRFMSRCTDISNFWLQLGASRRVDMPSLFSASLAIRRDLFEQLGGFDEHLTIREDSDLVQRARQLGRSSVYVPEIRIRHDHRRETFGALMRYQYANGVGAGLAVELAYPTVGWITRLRVACRRCYGLLVLPLAAGQTLQVGLASRHRGLVLLPMLPVVFIGYVVFHSGVWRRLQCH